MTDTRSWAYRLDDNGQVEARIFASKPEIPEGWVDTPAKLKNEDKKAETETESADNSSVGAPKMPDLSGMEDDEAKMVLDKWAEGLGIKLDRRKSLSNMLIQLEKALGDSD